MNCANCHDSGHVCENHPDRPWTGFVGEIPGACDCGAGMPCPKCCSAIPQDGTQPITLAFVPDDRRD